MTRDQLHSKLFDLLDLDSIEEASARGRARDAWIREAAAMSDEQLERWLVAMQGAQDPRRGLV